MIIGTPAQISSVTAGIFGVWLSVSFCDIQWTKRNKLVFWIVIFASSVMQITMAAKFEMMVLRRAYPFIMHLPLILVLIYLTKKIVWSISSVLTAYLCCQIRRWIAILMITLLGGDVIRQHYFEAVLTFPLLWALLQYISPYVKKFSRYPIGLHLQFGLIPVVSYIFDYLTRIYTDWLTRGLVVAVEFMPFVCSVAFLIFVIYSTKSLQEKSEMEQVQAIMDIQVKQSAGQLTNMKQSQQKMAAHRHDLRHHLQYVSACIDNGELEQAQNYIRHLNEEITNEAVVQYCENTAANLILSNYMGRAKEAGVLMEVRMRMKEFSHISDNDFCVLLSNALENALNACTALETGRNEAFIRVQGYEKGNRMFLEIINSCDTSVTFEQGIPVTKRRGHGLGVRSICAIVEKYGGIYSFEAKNGKFILQVSV